MPDRFVRPDLQLAKANMPRTPSASEDFHRAIVEKIRALERSLTAQQALSILCYTRSGEPIIVARLQFTQSPAILVHGWDREARPTYIMSSVYSLELVCKIMKKRANEKKKDPIGFDFPRDGGG